MTLDDVRLGFKKTTDAVPTLRAFKRAAMAGTVLPTGDALDTQLPTFVYIATVSLLDDALELIIDAKYPGAAVGKLAQRINCLEAKGELKDASRLHKIRKVRNEYAHEYGRYASWSEVESLFTAMDDELRHLGVL